MKTTAKKLHFTITGEYFTWLLRHMWVDPDPAKAIRAWESAFPDLATPKDYNSLFIDLVSGRMKFVGDSNQGMDLVPDGTKLWGLDEGLSGIPLIDCWEDQIQIMQIRQFIAELELRFFRMSRHTDSARYGTPWSLEKMDIASENRNENFYRRTAIEKWNDLVFVFTHVCPEKRAEIYMPFEAKFGSLPIASFAEQGYEAIRISKEGKELFCYYQETLGGIESKLKEKYGTDVTHINWTFFEQGICAVPPGPNFADRKEKQDSKNRELFVEFENKQGSADNPYIDDMNNLDKFIEDQIREDLRGNNIKSESIKDTQWRSGYISPEGEFYGCAVVAHASLAEDLCLKLQIKTDDPGKTLDQKGFVKISAGRVFFDKTPNHKQAESIADWFMYKEQPKNIGFTVNDRYFESMQEAFEFVKK